VLRREAIGALLGVGDAALGEWEQATEKAFHLRRRLSVQEAELVGPAVDVRGTRDGQNRVRAMQLRMPPGCPPLAEI
jgi:hypothetical protein